MSSVYDKYETVIGLEIHIQLNTKSKAFCSDAYEYGGLPNSQVSPISLGHPGTLPSINEETIQSAIKLGLALNCELSPWMHYARKNYFYADLPKGYQITQDHTPICTKGSIKIKLKNGESKVINITRIHMEEDAGKSIHDIDPYDTLIDLNRAGVPLLEVVSEPEMRSSEEAYQYIAEVRKLVRFLDICDGNLEEGSMRCDANVSVRLKGTSELGKRCEVKNMNSLRNVMRAIEFEAIRQIDLIEAGTLINQETRSFDAVNGTTFSLRSKEMANDYRYFPEPDLPPVTLSLEQIDAVRQQMPPLPDELFEKYKTKLALSDYDASLLTEDKHIALFFEELISLTKHYKTAVNLLMGEVKSYLNEHALSILEFPIPAKRLVQLIDLIESEKVSYTTASSKLFPLMLANDGDVATLAEQNNLIQDSNDDEIIAIAHEALGKFPEKVEAYKAGNKNLLGLFMGEFMKLAKGKANPKKANEILQNILNA